MAEKEAAVAASVDANKENEVNNGQEGELGDISPPEVTPGEDCGGKLCEGGKCEDVECSWDNLT